MTVKLRQPDVFAMVRFGDHRDELFAQLREDRTRQLTRPGYVVVSHEVTSDLSGGRPILVAHTVGLSERANHPELVVVGFDDDPPEDMDGLPPPPAAEILLHLLAERILQRHIVLRAGSVVSLAQTGEDPTAPTVAIGTVHPSRHNPWVLDAFLRYEPLTFTALQVLVPDDETTSAALAAGAEGAQQPRLDQAVADATPFSRPLEDLAYEAAAALVAEHVTHMIQLRDRETDIIRTHGWMVIAVFADSTSSPPTPPFCYTVGFLETFGHPELIVFGLPPEGAGELLNDLGEKTREALGRSGARDTRGSPGTWQGFANGSVVDDIANMPVTLRAIHPSRYGLWLTRSEALAREKHVPFSALQVVWPDPNGHFPWEDAFDRSFDAYQPRLYEQPG